MRTRAWVWGVLMAITMSCSSGGGSSGGAPTRQRFTLFWNQGAPAGGVAVSALVPAAWTPRSDPTGATRFEVPGLRGPGGPEVHLMPCTDGEGGACIDALIAREMPAGERAPKGDRVWVVARKGPMTHARLYIPAPAKGGVVVCVAIVMDDQADRLAELRGFCDAVRVEG